MDSVGKVRERKTREVLALVKSQGWVFLRDAKGSHEIWGTPDKQVRCAIPTGHRHVSPGVLKELAKKGVVIPDEWK